MATDRIPGHSPEGSRYSRPAGSRSCTFSVLCARAPCSVWWRTHEARLLSPLEQVSHILVQPSLIPLDRQHVVGPSVHYALGKLLLAAHRVDGYEAAIQIQHLQQPGYDLGMAVISLDLSSVLTCPGVRVFAEAQALTRWLACPPFCPGNGAPSSRRWPPPHRETVRPAPGSTP